MKTPIMFIITKKLLHSLMSNPIFLLTSTVIQGFWIDSVGATPPKSTVPGKFRGQTLPSIPAAGERISKAVTSSRGNGFMTILRTRYTMNRIALTCRTNWLATGMDGRIWGTNTGDGNHITVI